MNKSELVAVVAKEAGVARGSASRVIDAMLNAVIETLKEKDEVRIVGFGTFTTRERKETTARNPRTREIITVPASFLPVFRPGKFLKKEVSKAG